MPESIDVTITIPVQDLERKPGHVLRQQCGDGVYKMALVKLGKLYTEQPDIEPEGFECDVA